MSSFGAKRKARVIKVADDDENGGDVAQPAEGGGVKEEVVKPAFGSSKAGRKPFRQSGLRKSFNPNDEDASDDKDGSSRGDDGEDDGPAVIRPSIGRSGSIKQKKKKPKSRLSFGGDASEAGDEDSDEVSTPKKLPLGQRVLENSAVRRGIAARGLPISVRPFQDDDDRPKYSKEYLVELQSSTPNTPRDLSSLRMGSGDEMDLDPSELEGALIVDSPVPTSANNTTQILTEAEIRERKERRARLAKEKDFLSVEDDDEDDGLSAKRKKDDTRLVAEDEDLGEGFDDYVEDGGLSLGRRAEKERRKQERHKMAELINAAEGHTSDSSSDSDAERRIAYETAQTRAGLDGLKKPRKDPHEHLLQVPPKITSLPDLSQCVAQLQAALKLMEDEIKAKAATVDQLTRERDDIVKREAEVQAFLDETGRKYQEAMGQIGLSADGIPGAGPGAELAGERGLESLGATPIKRTQEDTD